MQPPSLEYDKAIQMLTEALEFIKTRSDCERVIGVGSPDEDCECPVCTAKLALEAARNWRYRGARFERTFGMLARLNPREVKMMAAWRKNVDCDRMLGMIISDTYNENGVYATPSARDWFVATSVVQWLATNVGIGVLEEAGFKYTQYEEDRAAREEMRREAEQFSGK